MSKNTTQTIYAGINFLIILGVMFLIFSNFSDAVKIILVPTAFLLTNVLGFAEGYYFKKE